MWYDDDSNIDMLVEFFKDKSYEAAERSNWDAFDFWKELEIQASKGEIIPGGVKLDPLECDGCAEKGKKADRLHSNMRSVRTRIEALQDKTTRYKKELKGIQESIRHIEITLCGL